MTSQEFIDNLSSKAKEIISNYECSSLNKRKIIIYLTDDFTRVDTSNPDAYIIYVKKHDSFNDMEYEFLHEFYHCVQKDEGFPNVSQTNIKYHRMASEISSAVLDYDVYDRLLTQGYYENQNKIKNIFLETKKILIVASKEQELDKWINDLTNSITFL